MLGRATGATLKLFSRESISFFKAMKSGFTNYINFTGRSSRSAYWYFTFGTLFLNGCISMVTFPLMSESVLMRWVDQLSYIILWIPQISCHTRRLHDVNKSGWNYLWYCTGIGAFYVLYLLVKQSDKPNKYGEHPIRTH